MDELLRCLIWDFLLLDIDEVERAMNKLGWDDNRKDSAMAELGFLDPEGENEQQ